MDKIKDEEEVSLVEKRGINSEEDIYAALEFVKSKYEIHRDSTDPQTQKDLFELIISAEKSIRSYTRNAVDEDWKALQEKFGHLREPVYAPLEEMAMETIVRIPPRELTRSQTEYYVQELLLEKYTAPPGVGSGFIVRNQGGEGRFFEIGPIIPPTEKKPGEGIVRKMLRGDIQEPTEEEMQQALEYESGVVKLHLIIPVDKRPEFVRKFIETMGQQKVEMMKVISHRRKINHKFIPDLDFAMDNDAPLLPLLQWKFAAFNPTADEDLEGNRFPDAVFYIPNTIPVDRRMEYAEILGHTVLEICEEIGLDTTDLQIPLARFSNPLKDNEGTIHRGITIAQGDGDFKRWLTKRGLLDRYYDKDTNYGVMKK